MISDEASTTKKSTNTDVKMDIKRVFQCTMCNANYNFKSNLITHMIDVHGHCKSANQKNHPYQCPICKETFPLKDSLRKHMEKNHEKIGS